MSSSFHPKTGRIATTTKRQQKVVIMPLKIAVLGTAHGHINVYLAQWKQHPEWDVQAVKVWDHDEARLREFSKNQQLEAVSDVDALLADPAIQAVVICAETSLHADLVEKAAAAGKAIAVQKPMATTLKDADRIVAAVNAHPGVTHNYLRAHAYNVWFTMIGPSWEAVCADLDTLSRDTGIAILNLPAEKLYKIRVNFQMEG